MAEEKYNLRMAVAERSAKEKGCVIVLPGPRELFVDIDGPQDEEVFLANVDRLVEIELCTFEVHPSPSGRDGRKHAVVTLDRDVESPTERVLLQLLLGSDRVREFLSWQRIRNGVANPTLFFEKEGGPYDPGTKLPKQLSEKKEEADGRKEDGDAAF